MGAYLDVNEGDWDSNVLQSDVPVLVDFWAPWCGPCRAIAPNVEALAEEYAGRLRVAKVNVDNNQSLAMKYGIEAFPHFSCSRAVNWSIRSVVYPVEA